MATMLMVSCRHNFWSATDFSQTDEVRRIDLASGVGTAVSAAEYLAEVRNKRIVVLVHGYNNEERDVVESYKAIDERMRLLGFLGSGAAEYDLLVGFAWPGGAAGVSFPFARMRAGESALRFAAMLSALSSAGATVDLNTHSLGAHVALEALRTDGASTVRFAWNFASAVDNESVEQGERYYASTQRCKRFYVFHSREDLILRFWYRVGDFFEFDTALGFSGPEDPGTIIRHSQNVRVVNCKDVVQSHGGYRSSGEVWCYMLRELLTPSSEQFVTLARTDAALNAVFVASAGAARAIRRARRMPGRHPGRKTRKRAASPR
jgi:esterase/lipase superfamily enzyme